MKRIISIPPNYLYLCIVICIPFFFILKDYRVILFPYCLLGLLLLPIGIFLEIHPWKSFKKHNTPENFKEANTALVKSGIYKYTRNPMYIGGILILTGLSISTGNLFSLLSPLIFFLVINYMFIPYEEEIMEKTFGKEYLNYKRKVKRWL